MTTRCSLLLLIAHAFLVSACGPSEAERKAAIESMLEAYQQQRALRQAQVAVEFEHASDAQLSALLSQCQTAILSMARQDYRPFEPFMVTAHSADRLQAHTYVSGGRIQKEGELAHRVREYRRKVKEHGQVMPLLLDSRFSVMVTRDTFSGPERMNRDARCEYLPGFKVEATWT